MSVAFFEASEAHFKHHGLTMKLGGEIPKASIVALQGASGCGKSTLLRCLSQAETPTVNFLLDHSQVGAIPPSARKISLVFQKPLLFPHLSVLENVLFPMNFVEPWKTWSSALKRERALKFLDELALGSRGDSLPGSLSGGEAMRVSLVRSLIVEPRFLLLDEPFSGLDKETKDKVKTWLKEKISSSQIPTLMVTHVEEDIEGFAQKRLKWPLESEFVLRF